jgi:hypothetical protein
VAQTIALCGLCLAAALWGCGVRSPQPDLLPEDLDGWRRTAIREVPIAETPAIISRTGLKQAREADYSGPGRLTVRIYELTSEPLALDLAQRWPPHANTVAFYDKNHFAVVTWQQADRHALQKFVRELERRLAL